MLKLQYAYGLVVAAFIFISTGSAIAQPASGQTTITLNDLSFFKNPGKSWSVASDVGGDLGKPNVLNLTSGTGVLVNLPNNNGADLFSNTEHGDLDLELDYMMAKGSNSGIYLQGRYEFQLLDSWGVKSPRSGDNGGIYERWDESRPEGQKGYGGHAPRQNVSRAPGLWQHLKISFQAPRFDASGKKTENAKIIRAELNGVTIHEDLELQAPTRGAVSNDESPTGPLRIQGDHGAVAFRNIKLTTFDKPRPELTNLKYTVFKGRYDPSGMGDITKLPPEAQGTLGTLTANNIDKLPNEYFIRYTGTLKVAQAGEYSFNVAVPGGRGIMKINQQPVNPEQGRGQRATVNLPAGDLPFELLYTKFQDWTNRSLGMAVSGPGVREFIIGDALSGGDGGPDPIFVDASANTILRSFMDLPGGHRVVHAVSVGSPEQVHYTYDMDYGSIVQVWRGGFLDATPMWYSRGDGSSRPVGAVQRFGKPVFTLAKLASPQAAWVSDTTGSGYTPKGYRMTKNDLPVFRYQIYGSMVEDAISVVENGQGLKREITVQNQSGNYFVRLADGISIDAMANDMYMVDGKSYYLKIDDAGGAKPTVRDSNGRKELIMPIQNKISYTILF